MNPSESQTVRTCTQCGNLLREGTPDSECPHCLLGLGLEHAEPDGEWSPRDHEIPEPGGAYRVIGDYELLELLGAGGMGMVYRARQVSLDRPVAIKMIRSDPIPRPELHERFRREARTIAQLRHPGIVTVHEVGEIEGQPYFSMELVDGGSLAERARMRPLPTHRAATYVRAVAQAIDYAHQQGVLHRDLKPSNILVDQLDQPKVSDFGVAKLLRGDSDLTLTGQRIGSPSYMAPEQASGPGDRVDPRTDVYGLGAVLYHLVAGRPPFIADTTERALLQVVDQEPIPLRRLNPSIPRDLETVCAKCLEKEPARRYPSAQALAEDLGRFLLNEPILAQPVGHMGKAWRWCRRNPLPASLGSAAALLLLVVAVGGPIAAARQASLAESNRRIAYGAALSAARQSWEIGNTTRAIDLLRQQIASPDQEELREFTWHYLWALCGPARQSNWVTEPSGAVFMSAISRDGSRFATSGYSGHVTVWDVATRTISSRFNTGGFTSGGLAFFADGSRLISTGKHPMMPGSDQLQIWDAATGARVAAGGEWTYPGDLSPDGRWFAAGRGGDIVVKDVQKGWAERTWPAHTRPIWTVRWSPDGTRLVSAGGEDQTAAVWDVATGALMHRLHGHRGEVRCGVFSPDGHRIATAGEDRTVRFWDVDTGAELTDLGHTHSTELKEVAWSTKGEWFASASFDGLVRLQNKRTGSTWTLRGHAQTIGSLRFTPRADQLITAALDGMIRFWDLSRLPPPDTALKSSAVADESVPVAFSPDSRWLATATTNATEVLLWQVATAELKTRVGIDPGDLQRWLPPAAAEIAGIRVDALLFLDDRRLAVACDLGQDLPNRRTQRVCIAVWDRQSETWVDAFPGGAPLRLSPDGKRLAMRCRGNGIQVRDLEVTGRSWPQPNRDALLKYWGDMAFSPDGDVLAVACASPYRLVLLDAATGKLIGEFNGAFIGPINAIAMTTDGRDLFTGGFLRRLQVWDVNRRTFIEEWPGHTNHVRAMAISPNGKTLVTGSDNGLIKFWSIGQRAELLTIHAHESRVLNLTFSPDGRTLASAGMEGTVRLWRAAPEE